MQDARGHRTDLVILGIALMVLGMTLTEPRGVAGRLLRGWFILMGLCTGIRCVTVRKSPRADRLLSRLIVVAGLAGTIAAIVYAIFF
jgi:hypothetical protein